jgi:cytochrome bd-I ubiquinol oxidase subunit X
MTACNQPKIARRLQTGPGLRKELIMWYFAWILGLPLAAVFAVVNAMWLEMQDDRKLMKQNEE